MLGRQFCQIPNLGQKLKNQGIIITTSDLLKIFFLFSPKSFHARKYLWIGQNNINFKTLICQL